MKSLTLHLIVMFLLGSLHNASTTNNNHSSNFLPRAADAASIAANTTKTSAEALAAAAAAATITTTSTTLQPPSLPKPQHRTLPTTAMMQLASEDMTTTTAASIESRRRRQSQSQEQQQQQPRQQHATLAHANSKVAVVAAAAFDDDDDDDDDVAVAASATFSSTRLVRDANNNITGNVRQNRSFQSGGAAQRIDNNNNSNASEQYKFSRQQQRRQQQPPSFRRIQYGSSTTSTASPAATRSSSSSQQQSLSSFMTNHRQSKQQQQEHQQHHQQLSIEGTSREQQESRRTTKTPRMIQRLVAGHIQNAEGRTTFEVSAVSSNSSVSKTDATTTTAENELKTTSPSTPLYFRRKPTTVLSSSYRQSKLSSSQSTSTTIPQSTPLRLRSVASETEVDDNDDDDEALLDDPDDFDNWDHGILRLSAGAGKENTPKSKKKDKEDSKKTLADQVRDGKYGLIEKEIFRRAPKRPGVLSYLPNKEVPIDNEHNYGGLNEEDIWLAEDHLLVIKGGSLNDGEPNEPWPAIDDYDSPGRQIKLPPNPKVPPPFPVQLEENGPVQFIGNNKFTVVYPVANESISIYTGGPETNNYASSETDDEDAKNLLARPGSPQNTGKEGDNEDGYQYPAPSPPWLYHNQTFVNPFLNNARPITFPSLGPFPFGRNGSSLDSANDTDDFDEDDPSLYYPPAYSFVYKSNYSNPVPPGPLVPGIVLPPPPEQFTRLEKPSKSAASVLPSRQRLYTTTTSTTAAPTTTTSTSTTTTTTTVIPFRQILTKISEYTPKTITITTGAPPQKSASYTPIAKLPTLPPPTSSPSYEPVPVPVAVPIPIYPVNHHYSKPRPNNIVSFAPTTAGPPVETFSKSNPIYYEYFEAKREPTTTNIIDEYVSTTPKPITSQKPIKIYATSKRPLKPHRNYLQPIPPNRQFVPENVVYITPKPEVRPYSGYKTSSPQAPIFKPRPLENFEREVNAIRQTLRYYQNQQLRDNNIPRTAKAKPLYEYDGYDGAASPQPLIGGALSGAGNFQPPAEYDEQPFKPMVTYSPPVDDENAFHAIAYDKVDSEPAAVSLKKQPKYQSTTTLVPVQPSAQYQTRSKKQRQGAAKYLEQPYQQQQQPQQLQQQQPQYLHDYQSTARTILTTQTPWISLDNEYAAQARDLEQPLPQQQQQQTQNQQHHQQQHHNQQQQHQSARLQQFSADAIAPRNRGFAGYYYTPPAAPGRQNNRFYDEPFQNPVRKIVNNYRPPPPQQQQQQQQQQPIWSLENDTYVNYAPNRPPLNPDAEFIIPYENAPLNPYGNQGQRFATPPPPLSHQSQYYAPPQRFPLRQQQQQQQHQQQFQQHQHQQQQQQQQIPLHRDILVNYRQPLPPINPDSEYISHPQVVRQQQPLYRANNYRLAAPAASAQPAEQSSIYYITPKYRRGSNTNINSNNNSGNRQ